MSRPEFSCCYSADWLDVVRSIHGLRDVGRPHDEVAQDSGQDHRVTANTHPRRCIGRAECPGRRQRPRSGRRGRRITGRHPVNVHNCSPPARPRRLRIPATRPGNGRPPDPVPPPRAAITRTDPAPNSIRVRRQKTCCGAILTTRRPRRSLTAIRGTQPRALETVKHHLKSFRQRSVGPRHAARRLGGLCCPA